MFNLQQVAAGSFPLAIGLLGTGTTGFTTQAAVFNADGVLRTSTAVTNQALSTTAAAGSSQDLVAGETGIYGVYVRASDGAVTITRLSGKANTAAVAARNAVLQTPQWIAGQVLIGYIRVVNNTNPFIAGTTALNAAGVTSTFVPLFAPLGRPLTQ